MARTKKAKETETPIKRRVPEEQVHISTREPVLPKWKFIGGGRLGLFDGRLVEMNEEFFAAKELIPTGFMDLVQLIDPGTMNELNEDEDVLEITTVKLENGRYNVMAGSAALNEEPLTLAEANAFIASLSEEE